MTHRPSGRRRLGFRAGPMAAAAAGAVAVMVALAVGISQATASHRCPAGSPATGDRGSL